MIYLVKKTKCYNVLHKIIYNPDLNSLEITFLRNSNPVVHIMSLFIVLCEREKERERDDVKDDIVFKIERVLCRWYISKY